MRLVILAIVIACSSAAYSQQTKIVSGKITDTTGYPLQDVYVKLMSPVDSFSTVTNASGVFRFPKVSAQTFSITATMVGFDTYTQSYTTGTKESKAFAIDPVKLRVALNQLEGVTVVSTNPITIKEDTIEYKASAYPVREGAPVEDVIKKLPGVTVDKDGNVTAQGKQVRRVRVNGKDYFGGDVQTATQNLPADIIDNIQIIDDYGDRANITGVKDGEPEKILNINIQKGKNKGNFGNGTVATGTKERYLARVSANNFNGERQISMLGSLNNTNANTFNFNGGGRGGGARGANFGSAERGGSGGDGTTYSSSLGFNYRDMWGKKISSYGSYSYSGRKNNTSSKSFQQETDPRFPYTNSSNSNSNTASSNHRLTWNIEYRMDTLNYLKVSPYLSYALSQSGNNGVSEYNKAGSYTLNRGGSYTLSKTQSQSSSTTPAWGSDFLYNHKFKKRGRNFSLSGSIDYSQRQQDRTSKNSYYNIDTSIAGLINPSQTFQNQFTNYDNDNTTTSIRVSYAEPLSKFTSVELSYTWNNSNTKSLRDVDDVDSLTGSKVKNPKQSNDYEYRFITNRVGLSLRTFKAKYNYSIGIVAQPSELTGKDIGRNNLTHNNNFNVAPSARFVYNFARSHSLTITYGGSSRQPSFTQLQPVSDSSNIKNIVTGNPNLNPEFTNTFSIQYNKVGILTGTSLFTNFSFDQTQNKIVSSKVYNGVGTGRSTSYLNTNGFYGFNGNFSFTQPFSNRKFSATISASSNYDNNISFTNNQKNSGQNWVIRPAARFRIDFTDIIDVDLNSGYLINRTITKDSLGAKSIREVHSLNFGIDGKTYFFKDWTLGYDFTKTINTGYSSAVNINPAILNLFVERRFLRNNKATIRLQGYDLFNQNTGISHDVNGTLITDAQNNRLGKYFLLSFNLRLQKFTGSRQYQRQQRVPGEQRQNNGGQRNGGGGGRGNGGGFGGGGGRGSGGGGRGN